MGGGANAPRLLKRSDNISQLRENMLNNAGGVERKLNLDE